MGRLTQGGALLHRVATLHTQAARDSMFKGRKGRKGLKNAAQASVMFRNAHRRIQYANGDVYEGEFWSDICKAHGHGEFTSAMGGKYIGVFHHGKFDGFGTFQYAD